MLSLAEMREVSREHMHEVWEQVKKGIPLEGEEKSLGDALVLHREFYPMWDRLLYLGDAEFSVAGVNPMLHVTLHAVLENQLAEKQPPEVGTTLKRLMSRGLTRHEASHLIIEKLIEEMAPVLIERRPFDVERYRRELLALGVKSLGSKVGRNEPCPCGSGRKFKRCCGSDGTGLTSRPAGPGQPGKLP